MGTIRIMLALAVVIFHTGRTVMGMSFMGGRVAVQSFFIISGFYMSLILNEKYINQKNSYQLFITNRFLRIYPVYWFILMISALYSTFVYYQIDSNIDYSSDFMPNLSLYVTYFESLSPITFIILVFSNISIFFQDILLFLGLDQHSGNLYWTGKLWGVNPKPAAFLLVPQAWSIALELTFYLLAPFILRRNLVVIGGLILSSIFLRLVLMYGLNLKSDPWTYRFFPTELAFFLLGNISYSIYKKIRNMDIKPIYLNLILGFMWFIIFFQSYLKIPMGVYLPAFVLFLPFVFLKTKNWKVDTYIGELSYPIYISHILVLAVVESLGVPNIIELSITVSLLTVLFSIGLNELFIKRLEKVRQNRIKNNKQESKSTAPIELGTVPIYPHGT